jgi:competence protein ComEA
MRKESADEVAEAARRRLALLGRELAGAGIGPSVAPEAVPSTGPEERPSLLDADDPWPALPALVGEPGRHSRRRPVPWSGRGVAWLQDRLPATLRGRVALGAGHVAVLAVVAALALAVTAWVTVRARPTVTAVPQAHTSPGAVSGGAAAGLTGRSEGAASPGGTSATAPTTGAPGAAGGSVVVDVSGKVRRPGVATLPAGSRVVDAIRQAGGARPGVDLTSLNLARVLVDGEQILVGVPAASGVAASSSSSAGGTAGASSGDGALVNLNTATLEQLDGLPGVGPVTAQKILDWRTAHGAFTAIDELLEVDGIGDKTLADMAPRLTL